MDGLRWFVIDRIWFMNAERKPAVPCEDQVHCDAVLVMMGPDFFRGICVEWCGPEWGWRQRLMRDDKMVHPKLLVRRNRWTECSGSISDAFAEYIGVPMPPKKPLGRRRGMVG